MSNRIDKTGNVVLINIDIKGPVKHVFRALNLKQLRFDVFVLKIAKIRWKSINLRCLLNLGHVHLFISRLSVGYADSDRPYFKKTYEK